MSASKGTSEGREGSIRTGEGGMGAHNQLMSVRRCRYPCEKKGRESGLHKRKECAGVSFRAHIQ